MNKMKFNPYLITLLQSEKQFKNWDITQLSETEIECENETTTMWFNIENDILSVSKGDVCIPIEYHNTNPYITIEEITEVMCFLKDKIFSIESDMENHKVFFEGLGLEQYELLTKYK
jgi:hypothetical protein